VIFKIKHWNPTRALERKKKCICGELERKKKCNLVCTSTPSTFHPSPFGESHKNCDNLLNEHGHL